MAGAARGRRSCRHRRDRPEPVPDGGPQAVRGHQAGRDRHLPFPVRQLALMASIRTARLTLRPWRETDRPAFADLNADPLVSADLGGPLSRAASDAKFDRYLRTWEQHGHGRWAIEERCGRFIGYAGVQPAGVEHPLGPHAEIGWRLARRTWGKGFATEAARAALDDMFARGGVSEV